MRSAERPRPKPESLSKHQLFCNSKSNFFRCEACLTEEEVRLAVHRDRLAATHARLTRRPSNSMRCCVSTNNRPAITRNFPLRQRRAILAR